jgi:putative spermidine/putrescine transport system permease protein
MIGPVGMTAEQTVLTAAPLAPKPRRSLSLNWIGVVPFLLFVFLFLIWPTFHIVLGAFRTSEGGFTFSNIANLMQPKIVNAFWVSIKISFASAALGCVIGFLIAAAMTLGGLPKGVRGPILTFSGVASNFAGVPLAFAILATLGPTGLITLMLKTEFGINLRAMGFNIYSFWGLTVTYLFFQIPLMILIIVPALDGLKREWREASDILGATGLQYWRIVALPILFPSLLGTMALLFANAFGAVATAIALTGSSLSIVPILLFAQIRGDVLQDPHLGYALAFGMIVVTGIANFIYIVLRARSERWIK